MVVRSLQGLETPRIATGPLAVHYCARRLGVNLEQYTTDPRVLADCVISYHEAFHPDAVWVSADTWITAAAMGARVKFPGPDEPMAGSGKVAIRSAEDIDRIPPANPAAQGRMPLMLKALEYVRQGVGDEVFVVGCFDQYPFSLCCALMGMDQAMLKAIDDRPMLDALMDRCTEYAVSYAIALAQRGADMLSGGDSPAGLLGPKGYREVAWPLECRVIQQIQAATNLPVSLHICGDATPILSQMAVSGADVLELDHAVDLRQACNLVSPDVALWGNIDPVGKLLRANPQQVQATTRKTLRIIKEQGRQRFVLSSGCTFAPDTPDENVRALLQASEI